MAFVGHGRGIDHVGCALSRRGAHQKPRSRVSRSTHGISVAPQADADFQLLRHAEHLLASAIGAASSRLVLSLLLRKRTVSTKAALKLLDDANAAIHYNREILQTALEHVSEAIAVFDKDMQLVCWNRQFGEILGLPQEIIGIGARLDEFLRFHAVNGIYGRGDVDGLVRDRLARYAAAAEPFLERFSERGLVVEVRANRMPDGGIVTTFTDITPSFEAAEALERRVAERTTELTRLNAELVRAKADAEEANISKTRFLAAASHDILQPLNAARLYVTSLVERQGGGEDARLVANVDASLDAVEEIFGALLDISRLDTGAMKPEIVSFRIDELLRQLELEYAPLAREKGLELIFVPSSADGALGPAPAAPAAAEPRLQRDQIHAERPRAGRLPPPQEPPAHRRLRHRARHSGVAKEERVPRIPPPQRRRQGRARSWAWAFRSWSASRACSITRSSCARRRGRARVSRSRCRCRRAVSPSAVRRDEPRADPGQLAGIAVLCIDNDPQILDGMQTLLQGWGCHVLKAPDLEARDRRDRQGPGRAQRVAGRLPSR